jgi:hypothetical protein
MHTVKAELGTQILAAREQLAVYETSAQRTMTQFGNDGGWDRSIEKQRAEVTRLEAELAGVDSGASYFEPTNTTPASQRMVLDGEPRTRTPVVFLNPPPICIASAARNS